MNEFDYIHSITTDEAIEEAQRLTQKRADELTEADKAFALYHLALMKDMSASLGYDVRERAVQKNEHQQ